MLNEGNFQENLKSMINEPDSWSKEEYYSAFLDMTERFFNALISALEYENVILEKFGEEAGEAIIAYGHGRREREASRPEGCDYESDGFRQM